MVRIEKEIVSLNEFELLIEDYIYKENVFYRGQADKTYNISCSLSRDNGYVTNEHLMISDTISARKSDFEPYKYPIEQLSKMQHYGIPTRLIDITLDPFTALYFAVEDSDNKQEAEVFIFEKEAYDLHSKEGNLLSLLAITHNYDIKYILNLYEDIYKNKISEDEIYNITRENKFIKFNNELSNTNERLHGQKGTFIICSNSISNKKINKSIQTVSKDEVSYIIRVPFEYKEKIKEELNIKYNVNKSTIYPELPNYASYIREKYKEKNSNKEEQYMIIETDDSSHALAKRIAIKIELKERLHIQMIKEIVYDIMASYQGIYDVIWIYVSSSEEDTIMYNWTVSIQWINENLDTRYRPTTIGDLEEDGFHWKYGKGVNFYREWNDKNVFEENAKLLNANYLAYNNLKSIYYNIKTNFECMDFIKFKTTIDNYTDDINKVYFNFTNLGKSRERNFNQFLGLFQSLACDFNNIIYIYKYEEKSAKYTLKNQFTRIDKCIKEIDISIDKWIQELTIHKNS